jgi:disulfide bond formation protein DsbB
MGTEHHEPSYEEKWKMIGLSFAVLVAAVLLLFLVFMVWAMIFWDGMGHI